MARRRALNHKLIIDLHSGAVFVQRTCRDPAFSKLDRHLGAGWYAVALEKAARSRSEHALRFDARAPIATTTRANYEIEKLRFTRPTSSRNITSRTRCVSRNNVQS